MANSEQQMENSDKRAALVLFDIDGTLVLTGRAGQRAMTQAFHDVYGIPDAFTRVAMAGRTDTSLVSDALRHYGIADTAEAHARFRSVYLERLATEIHHPGTGRKGIMPGARELLAAIRHHPHLHIALLTGNYRDAAVIKLSYFDLWNHFAWGAFSDDHGDRNALVPIARERSKSFGVPDAARQRAIVIGDTPDDVSCARVAGAFSIAVATGGFSVDQLHAAGADIVLDDLADTERVLTLLV
jgi:phosphoglycolate phosphatase-like HAD superfamily hydrolase